MHQRGFKFYLSENKGDAVILQEGLLTAFLYAYRGQVRGNNKAVRINNFII